MLRAGLLYFLAVFVVGFLLGTLRVLMLVPRFGERWAELTELPLMVLASFLVARLLIRRFAPLSPGQRAGMGAIALALLVAAELCLTVLLQERTLAEYVGARDPVSGAAYLVSLLAFAAMPLLAPLMEAKRRAPSD